MSIFTSLVNWLLPYKAKYWIIDISRWNTITKSHLAEMKANGLAGVWIQMANGLTIDPKLDYFVELCKQVGIPYGVYAWLDPTIDAVRQAQAHLAIFNAHCPDAHSWFVDLEQMHTSQLDMDTPLLSPTLIYNSALAYINYVTARYIKPFGIYSGPAYLAYVPALAPLCKKYFYWNATYGTNAPQVYQWPQFQLAITHVHASVMPAGFLNSDVDVTQFVSSWKIAYNDGWISDPFDFDAMQDDDAYSKLFGQQVIIIPPTPDTGSRKVINCLYLSVRTRPDPASAGITYLMVGDIVKLNSAVVIPTGQTWANVTVPYIPWSIKHPIVTQACTGWVNAYYLGQL